MTNFRELMSLSLPMVVGQLAFAAMSFIDTLLMGKLGVEVLAGGGLGAVVYQFVYIVGIGIQVATGNLIAFAKGERRHDRIQQALLSGSVAVVMMFVFFGLIIWNIAPLLLMLGQPPETVVYAERYLQTVVWGLLPAFGFTLLRSFVLGIGDPSALLPISIAAAVFNYPLSYALMTGMWGLPEMGIRGIALGTCIISYAMMAGLSIMVYRRDIFKPYPFWSQWQLFSFEQLKETFALGIPIALAHAMEVGLFAAAALLVGLLGVNALAAHHVALQCATLAFMVPLGISQAVSVKVGESFGGGNLSLIKSITKSGLILATLSAGVFGLLFCLAPEFLVSLFVKQGEGTEYPLVLELATGILFVAALFQLVDAWQVILMGGLRGLKLGVSPTVIAVFSYWLVGFPCSYWLMGRWGAPGVWMGLGAGLATSALMLIGLFVFQLNKLARQDVLR